MLPLYQHLNIFDEHKKNPAPEGTGFKKKRMKVSFFGQQEMEHFRFYR